MEEVDGEEFEGGITALTDLRLNSSEDTENFSKLIKLFESQLKIGK